MVEYKCTNCNHKTTDDKKMMVLSEYHMGFGSLKDYIVCIDCWDFL